MSSADNNRVRPTHWKTLEELRGDSEVARLKSEEFFEKPRLYFDALEAAKATGKRPGPITEAAGFVELAVKNNGSDSDLSRRDFLKLSAFAAAFATAGCALRPAEKIIPYVKAPAEIVPGVANYYASTMAGAAGTGVLIRTREGRPVKIEGNPDHPLSQGKLDVRGQLAIFSLYDPDRLTTPAKLKRGANPRAQTIPWSTAEEDIVQALTAANGRVALLTGTIHGPARTRLIAEFLRSFSGARHVQYDAWTYEATRSAQEACYGANVLPHYRPERASYLLFLDCDPLGSGFSPLEWQIGFGHSRTLANGKMSRAVAFEPFLSLTGSNCDERFKVRSADTLKVALAVARDVAERSSHPAAQKPEVRAFLSRMALPSQVEKELHLPNGSVKRAASDLIEHRGHGLVMGGENEALQIVVNFLNTICENDGRTVDGTMSPSRQANGRLSEMLDLISDMKAGRIDVLIVHGTNPAYWLPESAGWADAVKKVKTIVSLADRIDETSAHGDYVLPGLHWLENWGDAEPQAGLYSLMQPAILPLHDNRAAEDTLLNLAKAAKAGPLGSFPGNWHEFLKETWKSQIWSSAKYDADFETFWISVLRDGVLNTVIDTEGEPREYKSEALTSLKVPASATREFELVVYSSPNLGDGTQANIPWLLETPDPVSRITWTNYASVSPATAQKLGVKEGDWVKLEVNGITAELQAHLQPGDLDDVVSVQAGWGRTHAGRIANGVGTNAFAFRKLERGALQSRGLPCVVTALNRPGELPSAHGHNYIEGRPIIAETTLGEYLKDPHAGQPHEHQLFSMWPEHPYDGYRWGMSIDLSACIGCNACLVACQVENNIPVVGREQVQRGRELHWIRIDRYYSGDEENPDVTYQPMLCQHCENAPCETVCPVVATVHNEEGLNQQIYNRCVGTRYCANNCPYKVRRFNWLEFSFAAYDHHPLQLVLNPDVTVREKGVMEKCTFCVHRIREGKDQARKFGRKVTDADIRTACQQTCPTGAIVFGDINNPDSAVSQRHRDERSYHVLELLNTKPQVAYWTKLRHRDPKPGSGSKPDGGHHA